MIVEPSPSEIHQRGVRPLASAQQHSKVQSSEPERTTLADDGDFGVALSPPPRWPRIFPDL